MQIDVTDRIETAKRLTAEWADRAGYKKPLDDGETDLSPTARNLRRILSVSDFGCQTKNVHALLKVLIGEDFPAPVQRRMADYLNREPFAIGSVLVPISYDQRAGIVTRVSGSGNAGLRKSNGEMHNNHFQQSDLRPATDEEIDAYFAEFFGVANNPDDQPGADDNDYDIPF